MRLTFLGTGAGEGYPDIFCECERCREARTLGGRNLRLRSSLLVSDDLLLDLGPDLVASAHRCGISLSQLCTPLDVVQAIQAAFPNLDEVLMDVQRIRPFESWEHGGYSFTSYQAFHAEGHIESLFYGIDDGHQRCLYATDTGPFPEAT